MRGGSMVRWVGAALGLLIATAGAYAEETDAAPSLDNAQALEAWVDGVMEAHLDAYDTAGSVIAIVKDGEQILGKGYGWADVEARTPVDPDKTLFRIASVSKLFVWLSVMQLVEQGALNLDTDVNAYLDTIHVPDRYGGPVTLKDLLTHSGGFDEQVVGLFRHEPESVQPLEAVLKKEMPSRVRRAAGFASYSNHGTALAMHVVEQQTGMTWDRYIQENILDPLGLDGVMLAQTVPDTEKYVMSRGYRFENGTLVEKPFEFVPLAPVGGLSATANAMARFITMLLNDGELDGTRILKTETAVQMREELHRMAPEMNPMRHGLIDESRPGIEVLGHGGDTRWFHSQLAILPEHNVGFFVSYNTAQGAEGRSAFMDQFLERYFGLEPPEPVEPQPDFARRAHRYEGSYRSNRFSRGTLAKLATAINPVTVRFDGKDALIVSSAGNRRWREVAEHTFRSDDSHRKIVFIPDADGSINHFAYSDVPIIAFERNTGFYDPTLHRTIFFGTLVFCVWGLIMWPLAPIVRWRFEALHGPYDYLSIPARLVGWITCAGVIAFVILVGMQLGDPEQIVYGVPPELRQVLFMPYGILLLVLGMGVLGYRQWATGRGSILARLAYSLLTLTLVAFLWQLFFWNLTYFQNLEVL